MVVKNKKLNSYCRKFGVSLTDSKGKPKSEATKRRQCLSKLISATKKELKKPLPKVKKSTIVVVRKRKPTLTKKDKLLISKLDFIINSLQKRKQALKKNSRKN